MAGERERYERAQDIRFGASIAGPDNPLQTDTPGRDALGDEQVAITATAAGLASIPADATRAFCTVEMPDGEYARFRVTGTAADGTTGHQVKNEDTFALDTPTQLANLSIIRDTDATGDGTLVVTYF